MNAQNKVRKVMGEFGSGSLRSSSGQKVTNPKQAMAIALSEQRRVRGMQAGGSTESDVPLYTRKEYFKSAKSAAKPAPKPAPKPAVEPVPSNYQDILDEKTRRLEEKAPTTRTEMGKRFAKGGNIKALINRQNTRHGKMDMPYAHLNKYVGKRHGGNVKAYQAGGVTDENFLKQRREDIAARKAAADADAEAVRLAKAKRVYDRSVRRYENEVESERNSPANRAFISASDSVGDFIRGVGKRLGTNRTLSQDDEAQMQARRDVRGYKKGGGIEKRGKTRGAIVRMAAGGSVSARADGIAQRGKTKCKIV